MMTQSYYGDGYDAFGRPNPRAPSSAAYYERPNPYSHSYYDANQQDLRSDYVGRNGTRTLIQEQGSEHGPAGLQRRRIQVACSRCRRRKIKCTGDPGDGSGCSACRSAGADRSSCTFIRVGSHSLSTQVLDVLPTTGVERSTTPTTATYSAATLSGAYQNGVYQSGHRPSLPLLQTRLAYPEYESYGTSPPDEYSCSSSSLPRQHSYSSSNYGAESFRPWTAGTIVAPVTSTSVYYEPGTAFSASFGSLQAAPSYTPTAYTPAPVNRLPGASSEAFSPLNMASMHTSLPSQTVQERRLPIPYTQTHAPPTYMTPEVPQIRPLGSFTEPRAHINGIYSRNGMPWSSDNPATSSTSSRVGSLSSIPNPRNDSANTTSGSTSSSYTSDPILGYQFSASTGSPTTSPTAGPPLSESFQGASNTASAFMLPPASRTRIPRGSSYPNLPSLTGGSGDEYQQPSSSSSSSSREAAASLYSFSTGVDLSDRVSSERQRHHRHRHNNDEQSHTSHRTSQPQHAASVDELRRRSHDQQQRSSTAHRMSVSNINGRC
ncbi:uncharacterized protein RCC_01166 [Ramularia collo-cygni]|uniref:Zn(2)-C6 fungal-type domain-containing protein n=1 Tax=Ramularia collo-cygni TaxID=112498 RepID=A0A2D3ULP9_9PEZI|nr:uncharacterized protein RCC_01166 [Ramularia collo-cygni]CZT15302.1 uncharacterized protein RCC_01166 [Ramularia collo-cygni]